MFTVVVIVIAIFIQFCHRHQVSPLSVLSTPLLELANQMIAQIFQPKVGLWFCHEDIHIDDCIALLLHEGRWY